MLLQVLLCVIFYTIFLSFVNVFTTTHREILSSPNESSPISHNTYVIRSTASPIHIKVSKLAFLTDFATIMLWALIISSTHATCSTHINLLHSIALIIFGKNNKLRISSLCNFFYPSYVTSGKIGYSIQGKRIQVQTWLKQNKHKKSVKR